MSAAPLLLLLLALATSLFLPLIPAQSSDYPTANLSTQWTLNSPLPHNFTYPDNSLVIPLLLRETSSLSFAFGFFCPAPCHAFLLSIFIVHTSNDSTKTSQMSELPQVVWSANRNLPVGFNASVVFSPDGDLVLRDSNGSFVWSTNTSGHGAEALILSSSGDLQILDGESKNLWASFDHPTDTLLLSQTLREGQRLTAANGKLYLTVLEGLQAFVDSDPPQLYYSRTIIGASKSPNQTAFMTFSNGTLNMFVLFLQPGVPDIFISLPLASSYQYMRLEDNGHLRLYGWNDGWALLKEVIEIFPDDCAYPTVCGQYGVCSNGQCSCPQSANGDSSYFKPVNATEITSGCTSLTPLSCQDIKSHQFLALHNVSYFNYIDPPSVAIENVDAESCKKACLRNCSCKAALFQYGRNASLGSCYLPSEIFSLMYNRPDITHYNSSAFLKVQTAITASTSGGAPGTPRSRSRTKALVIGVVCGIILAGLLIALVIFCLKRKAKQLEEDQLEEIPGMLSRFSYEELKSATKNFEQKLGQGGFGTVFKGTLRNDMEIAVKRLDGVGQGRKQFLAEVETIGSIHHINLVSLIGFCFDKSQKFLVLEYMPNGSLDTWIFGKKMNSLDWKTRQNIIIGIAKGLLYLHEDCRQTIAHLDIKPQNILLDEKFNAKIADFGLSKLIDRDRSETMTRMRGTPGYLAPEWLTSVITEKVDVYSFGVVVIEIICGRKNLDPSQDEEAGNLIALVQDKLRDNLLADLFDKNCSDIQMHTEEVLEMMKLAIWCLNIDSNRRPSMSMVVKVLEGSSILNFDTVCDLLDDNQFM